MRTHIAMGMACAGVASVLALSGCTHGSDGPEESPASVTASPSPSATVMDPSAPVNSSLPAGIPTAKPSPATTAGPSALNGSVLITLATVDPDTGGLLVGGYVSGVAEDGGDCQYVVTPATGDSFTIHQGGVENNGSTSCGSTTVPKSRVPAGSYSVVLRYSNDLGQVESDAVKVVVP